MKKTLLLLSSLILSGCAISKPSIPSDPLLTLPFLKAKNVYRAILDYDTGCAIKVVDYERVVSASLFKCPPATRMIIYSDKFEELADIGVNDYFHFKPEIVIIVSVYIGDESLSNVYNLWPPDGIVRITHTNLEKPPTPPLP